MSLAEVRRVADAVLYEGYILYPYRASAQKNRSRWQFYRASAQKNRSRWQFGVLMPPGFAAADPSETSQMQAECVFEHRGQPTVEITVRFLQVQRRRTEGVAPDATVPDMSVPAGNVPAVWDEAVEQEVTVPVTSQALLGDGTVKQFAVPGGVDVENTAGARVVRRRERLTGSVSVHATPLPGPWQAARLTVRVANESAASPESGGREGSAGRGQAAASRDDSVASHVGSACAVLKADSASRVSLEQRSQALPGKCSFTTACHTVTGI